MLASTPKKDSLDNAAIMHTVKSRLHMLDVESLDELSKWEVSTLLGLNEHRNKLLWVAVTHAATGIDAAIVDGVKDVCLGIGIKLLSFSFVVIFAISRMKTYLSDTNTNHNASFRSGVDQCADHVCASSTIN